MDTSIYVGLSGQMALDQRMSTIAQNIANANTVGYRAGGVDFATIISNTPTHETAFVSEGKNHMSELSGGFTRSGNPLDVAVQGNGFLGIQSPSGTYYSRDGRLSLNAGGQLVNTSGHNLLDSGGSPIQLDPSAGAVTINKDGTIFQSGKRFGQIGLFSVDTRAGFRRVENSGVVPVTTPEPISDHSSSGILQGFVEESNVNAVTEMVRLIQVTRAFEAASSLTDKASEAQRNAIQTLGSHS